MAAIIRGTTPTVQFTFKKIDVDDIAVAYISVKQNKAPVIEQDLTEATVSSQDNTITWRLTQDQTLLLSTARNAKIVCDWRLDDGTRGRSATLEVSIDNPGKDEVI